MPERSYGYDLNQNDLCYFDGHNQLFNRKNKRTQWTIDIVFFTTCTHDIYQMF